PLFGRSCSEITVDVGNLGSIGRPRWPGASSGGDLVRIATIGFHDPDLRWPLIGALGTERDVSAVRRVARIGVRSLVVRQTCCRTGRAVERKDLRRGNTLKIAKEGHLAARAGPVWFA